MGAEAPYLGTKPYLGIDVPRPEDRGLGLEALNFWAQSPEFLGIDIPRPLMPGARSPELLGTEALNFWA